MTRRARCTPPRMQRRRSIGSFFRSRSSQRPVSVSPVDASLRAVRQPSLVERGEMGRLHVTQIEARLNATVAPHIDVSDLETHRDTQLRALSNTRSLAAFVVMQLGGLEASAAAACVTDGTQDNGIDAIAVIPDEHRMLLVQAKWANDSRGSAALDDMIKLREGLDDLVQFKWTNFNERVRNRREEIEELLLNPSVKIQVVFAHMGTGHLAEAVRDRMDQYLADLNDPTETANFIYLDQSKLHRLLLEESEPLDIDLSVELSDWGQLEGPPRAVYGRVPAAEVARWVVDNGDQLFAKNVRVVLPDSEVNEGLLSTLEDSPESFWYFNNGITVLCNEIEKAPAGGSDRRVGSFDFRGATIVNGAQTAGSLAKAQESLRREDLSRATVMVRFISLEGSPADFARDVTRATNTQNRIGGRDFVALDPEQARIKDEFKVEGLQYVYRSGEEDPRPEDGCGIVQATIALACSHSALLTTQAKREISRLWDDISRAPYKSIFNASTTYLRVWRAVQVLRVVDEELARLAKGLEGREKLIAIHGNRALLNLAYDAIAMNRIEDPDLSWANELGKVRGEVPELLSVMVEIVEDDFPGYPASLFKNSTKVAALIEKCSEVRTHESNGRPSTLF